MIKRILGYFFFFDLILSLFIALLFLERGLEVEPILLGPGFSSFIATCSKQLSLNKVEIPNIPTIEFLKKRSNESISINNAWDAFRYAILQYQVVVDFFNFFIGLLNGTIGVLNTVVYFVNLIIELFHFLGIMIVQFYQLITGAVDDSIIIDPITPPWHSLYA